ncbi:MAG: diguanylate cyclase [Chloroflexi bacterium]|nr:diguanylate cyclase [Chloroflexota bacterium]
MNTTGRKTYDGYRAYQYLEAGTDFPAIPLVPTFGRVPSRTVEVSAAQEARVQRLLDEHTVISLHDHPRLSPVDLTRERDYRRNGRDHTSYEGLAVSGLDALFDGMMDGSAFITSSAGWKWDDIVYDLGMRLCDMAHQRMLVRGETLDDLRRAKANGQIAFIAHLEAATPIENEVDRLDVLYGMGIRCCGVTYSMSNTLGGGGRERGDGGLTDFGRRAVKRMNQLGMAIDVSHAGDRTARETIEASRAPIFITHVGARALWDTTRMKPDDVFRLCAERGGVIGIEAAPMTTMTARHPAQNIEAVMEHFEHVASVAGIDHVAFGPDTNFGDHLGHLKMDRPHIFRPEANGGRTITPVDYVDGLENPVECFPNIARWLVKHSYSDTDIGKVLGGNVLRVLEQAWSR